MQEVGECFGPVLPGMRACVLSNEGSLVIRSIGAIKMFLESSLIASGLVSEDKPEWSDELCLGDKKVPIKMADLVTKMAEQRPVRLSESDASCFALNVVSFGKVQCDEASQVAGHDRSIPRIFGKYIKTEPGGIFRRKRQLEPAQVIYQAPLRPLNATPQQPVLRRAKVWDCTGQSARTAIFDFALQPPNCS